MDSTLKKILILGSGMMVEPLIDFLLKNQNNRILVGTNIIKSMEAIISKKNNPNLTAEELDVVQDKEKLNLLVKNSDIVISYLPPFLHETIAKECLKEKKNMMTTSYVNDAIYKLNDQVKKEGLIFMNEIGLDPGIDHLITHKVINEANKKGDKIIHYESWCGALCSPEYLNNPLLYKFTWSPRGALMAIRNMAKQYINGNIVQIPSNELLVKTTNKNFHNCFNFEGYYNRDSLAYKDLYDLKDAETVIRGTIRFRGFGFVIQCLKNLGLFEDSKIPEGLINWRNYFYSALLANEENTKLIKKISEKYITVGDELFIPDKNLDQTFEGEDKFYIELSMLALSKFTEEYIKENDFKILFNKIYSCLKYLDLYEDNNKV
jgi:saccharopine dehydrogenase-like NADP-dependent oxidoreductase